MNFKTTRVYGWRNCKMGEEEKGEKGMEEKEREERRNGTGNTIFTEKRIFTDDYAIEVWELGRPDSPINLPAICNACHGHPWGIPLETPPPPVLRIRIVYVGVARQVLSRKTVLCPQWSVTKPRIGDRDGSPLFYYIRNTTVLLLKLGKSTHELLLSFDTLYVVHASIIVSRFFSLVHSVRERWFLPINKEENLILRPGFSLPSLISTITINVSFPYPTREGEKRRVLWAFIWILFMHARSPARAFHFFFRGENFSSFHSLLR